MHGVPADRPIDSIDLTAALTGSGPSPRHELFYYWDSELRAVRKGKYKAHFITSGAYDDAEPRTVHDPPLLFDLSVDPAERFNIAAEHPDVVADLIKAANAHRATVAATTPLFDGTSEVSGGSLMKRTWTIIGVNDVASSVRWYQSLFGQPETAPEHDDFGQLLDSDGTVLLCVHAWGAHEHPPLLSPDHATPGNGLLLFFRVDDFDLALPRARRLVARLAEEPHINPNTRTMEFSLRDPDGYYVSISAL